MSKLPGHHNPAHWHDARGGHRMPDPRLFGAGYPKPHWDSDDRAYVRHLERHEELAENPEPMDGDPREVSMLFEHIRTLEATIAKEKLLITALRQKAAQAQPDELEGV